MRVVRIRKRGRVVATSCGAVLALATAAAVPVQVAASPQAEPRFTKHSTVVMGLDNPRQLSVTANGNLLVAEAGHGSTGGKNCFDDAHGEVCVGKSGAVLRYRQGKPSQVMSGLLSGAGKDGSFATGPDGASKRVGGPYYAIITSAPPDLIPSGLPGRQAGKLLAKAPGGRIHAVANVSGFEARHDPDGEGVDSNPYSVLALRKRVLVADAAGDYIAQLRHGKLSLWSLLPEYGKRVDAVPTVISKGADGKIYVGELHSELRGKAKVWKYDRFGNALRSWGHFTTVTGVARGADGSLYVSELFGGNCSFDQIPDCFPGRVVRVSPDGTRSYRKVPFPAGVTVNRGRVYVAAFSTSPATGFGGNPDWSGAIWRLFPKG